MKKYYLMVVVGIAILGMVGTSFAQDCHTKGEITFIVKNELDDSVKIPYILAQINWGNKGEYSLRRIFAGVKPGASITIAQDSLIACSLLSKSSFYAALFSPEIVLLGKCSSDVVKIETAKSTATLTLTGKIGEPQCNLAIKKS